MAYHKLTGRLLPQRFQRIGRHAKFPAAIFRRNFVARHWLCESLVQMKHD